MRSRLMGILARAVARQRAERSPEPARRRLLRHGAALAMAAATPGAWAASLARPARPARVIVVGGGLAGLCATDALVRAGLQATLFEAAPRVGGRCLSERRAFAPQVAERGGEFIDTGHATIRALCDELDLALDDVLDAETPGTAPLWWLDGAPYTLAQATADLAGVLPGLDADIAALGDTLPSYRAATPAQRALDTMSAARWIDTRVPGGRRSRLGRLLANAYTEELGGDPEEISAVTVVALLQATPRDALSPYAESDQRFHVRGGNDAIAQALAARLADRIVTGTRLTAVARGADGRCRLAFARYAAVRVERADRVVLALPFTLLRDCDLARAAFRARKLSAIRTLGMGRNTKLQLQFTTRHWRDAGVNGETRVEGPYLTSWEATRAQDGASGVLNFFTGGRAAVRAGEGDVDSQARAALAVLESVLPGSAARFTGAAIRNAWDRHPWSRGSYALLRPGQYAAFHGVEWEPEGPVFFAGEHTSDAAAGYLEGAVESGLRAAAEVAASLATRRAA